MKKFLGILGTIITAGSGMTGIVGNAPALAKNEINYLQTNNLKTLNRNKRAISSLNIPEVQQLGSVWCGPAVVESILRYMGVTWEDVINGEQVNTLYYHNFQNYLASLMRTNEVDRLEEPISGTLPSNLLEVLNTFINRYVSPSIHSSLNRNFFMDQLF